MELDVDDAQFLGLEADIDLVRAVGLAGGGGQDGGELRRHGFGPGVSGQAALRSGPPLAPDRSAAASPEGAGTAAADVGPAVPA